MKKTVLRIGIVVLCVGLIGVYNAISDLGKAPVEKKDLQATGIITNIYGNQLKHELTGVVIDTHYKLDYSFVTEDGEKYTNTKTISESQFRSLKKGQEVTVLYHSNLPSINGMPGLGTYRSVKHFPSSTPKNRLWGCLATCGFGAFFIVGAIFGKEDDTNGTNTAS